MTTRFGSTPASSRISSCSSADFPGMPVCVKIGRLVATVRLADRAKHLPFVPGDVVPRSDLAEHANRIGLDLLDERLDDLLLAHGGDLFRIERLRVEAAAGHDRHARLHATSAAGS